jgi:hypothetical protein
VNLFGLILSHGTRGTPWWPVHSFEEILQRRRRLYLYIVSDHEFTVGDAAGVVDIVIRGVLIHVFIYGQWFPSAGLTVG